MPPKAIRTDIVSVRFMPKILAAVEKAAYDSHRTRSNWIEVACAWALENKVIPPVPRPK